MKQSPTTKVPTTPPARLPVPRLIAVLAALLTVAALVVAVNLSVGALQEKSGLGMVYAGAAWLISALSLMVAIHSARS